MARLAKGMDPLGDISSEDDEAEGSGSEPERDPEPVKKKPTVDYATLSQHGYKSGPSVLLVPESSSGQQSWDWGGGSMADKKSTEQEDAEDRAKTIQAMSATEVTVSQAMIHKNNMQILRDEEAAARKKHLSFNQKEKRKRDLGQQAKSKNFVEEEKRILRQGAGGYDK
mmetsp:Transcript_10031/g.18862  ORF Transcript_10031/g.18862 Transcript_10031/m.18862 type:complete len:169 (+) Transcript_10031:122-628(+)|eukprot:CAMPEP_0114253502 /NCGR_PEP_ID=MMETSP0058-20121206/16430_1 /TAXON_ID=36894 /ORGANISM="Pyramimonas parkeae, CCMP726" /LENGTH=168 /DNA_ID=CAMNT_0001367559 /DNA_START=117 /DNA_END=623 /DNA_ORIENTATION=-